MRWILHPTYILYPHIMRWVLSKGGNSNAHRQHIPSNIIHLFSFSENYFTAPPRGLGHLKASKGVNGIIEV